MPSAKELLEVKIAGKLRERPELAKNIGVAVAINLKGEGGGRWVIDMSKPAASVVADAKTAAVTTISMEASIFEQLATGQLDPQTAFLTGKVKVDGNLGIAIKLGQLFS